MKKTTWYKGVAGKKYGVYNSQSKKFQFGISEDSPMLARARLFYLIGEDARKWRFEVREIPKALVKEGGNG